jgi:hypothetical protein
MSVFGIYRDVRRSDIPRIQYGATLITTMVAAFGLALGLGYAATRVNRRMRNVRK